MPTAESETSAINIHDPVAAICERLGLNYADVAELVITPTTVRAHVFKTNGRGAKYVDPDTDGAAAEDLEFDVTT